MTQDEHYIQRCIDLALKGGNNVRSNPHVGAVIVHYGQIIGEGYHRKYGSHHAEVEALNSVDTVNKKLIPLSTIYVSLEPCNHFGKTPPCVDAIIESGIKKVIIGSTDPSPKMMGKSVQKLRNKGISVMTGVLQKETDQLTRRFKANLKGLPFVTIKFAQSKDFLIGSKEERVLISGEGSSIFTHKLRAQSNGILIGTNTCKIDNPSLTTRHYPGDNPLRIVLDRNESIPKHVKLLSDNEKTLILTLKKDFSIEKSNKKIEVIDNWEVNEILKVIYSHGVHSLLVEGGAKIIKWFVKEKVWHDAFILTSDKVILEDGIKAPKVRGKMMKTWQIQNDHVSHVVNFSN